MQIKSRSVLISILVVLMAYGAFVAGSRFRLYELDAAPTGVPTVQANAMLNFTPECPPVSLSKANLSPSDNRELFSSILRLVRTNYVDPITPERETAMARGAVKGMLNSILDPNTHFLEPGEKKLLDDASNGKFHGIGAILALRNETNDGFASIKMMVVSIMPGSPAEAVGLKPGDSITHVNGKWVITYDPFATPEMTKAEKGFINRDFPEAQLRKMSVAAADKVKKGITITQALETLTSADKGFTDITVERQGEKVPIELKKVALRTTVVEPVTSKMLNHGIMYMRLSQFNTQAVSEFNNRVDAAEKSANRPRALILDLRNNPGGQMDAAKKIVARFTGGGLFATIEEKGRVIRVSSPKLPKLNMPIAVIVNGGTASVSELVAGDLMDENLAALVGTRTFGDGLAKSPLVLKDGSEAILTTGKVLTAHGTDFNGKGLTPSKIVSEDRSRDAQLFEAEKLLSAKL